MFTFCLMLFCVIINVYTILTNNNPIAWIAIFICLSCLVIDYYIKLEEIDKLKKEIEYRERESEQF